MDPERCRRFNDAEKDDYWTGSYARIHSMDIQPDSRILDVGTGPVSLAIPLTKIVTRVTAVEPSEGMVTCLRENIIEAGFGNITVVPKYWEDIDIVLDLNPPYNIFIALYLLGSPDLREGFLKMYAASSKYVYIFWFADMISPRQRNIGDIWEQLFGVLRLSGTKPNIIFNLSTK